MDLSWTPLSKSHDIGDGLQLYRIEGLHAIVFDSQYRFCSVSLDRRSGRPELMVLRYRCYMIIGLCTIEHLGKQNIMSRFDKDSGT